MSKEREVLGCKTKQEKNSRFQRCAGEKGGAGRGVGVNGGVNKQDYIQGKSKKRGSDTVQTEGREKKKNEWVDWIRPQHR